MHRRSFLAGMGAAGLATVAAPPLVAQPLPPGPVRMVVGFAAGGSTDAMARIIGEKLAERIGRPVVVENVAGASGRLAAEQVRRAPPNGSTLLVGHIGLVVLAPVTFRDLPFHPLKDFAPVVRASDFQLAVAASRSTGAADLPGLIAWLKAHPGEANVGVPLQASLSHLTALRFAEAAAVQATTVVYRGSSTITPDMLGGRIAAGVAAVGDFAEQHRAGSLRIVAVSGTKRAPSIPDVPTFSEGGLAGFEGNGWNGFLLPAGTPAGIVELFNREILAAVADPEVARKLDALGFVPPPPNNPAEFAAEIERGMAAWRPIVKAAGLEQ